MTRILPSNLNETCPSVQYNLFPFPTGNYIEIIHKDIPFLDFPRFLNSNLTSEPSIFAST